MASVSSTSRCGGGTDRVVDDSHLTKHLSRSQTAHNPFLISKLGRHFDQTPLDRVGTIAGLAFVKETLPYVETTL